MRMTPFDEVLVDVTSRSPKLSTAGYREHGRFPVIDQGASHTAGRTDDESLVTRADRPLILFGDHTRRFKLIDEDFVVGAEGLKVLAVGTEHDARYVFHALRSISLPDAGYSRHFKYLRRARLPVVPRQQQQRIAALLDQVDELRAKRRRTLALLDEWLASEFHEAFGHARWPEATIGDLLLSASYGSSTKAGPDGEFPMLRMGNVTPEGRLDLKDLKYVDLADKERDKYLVRRGDLLFNRTNSVDRVGKTALYDRGEPMAYAGYLIRLRLKPDNQPEYLAAFLNTKHTKAVLRSMAKSIVGMANINAKELAAMKVPLPPADAQRRFVTKVTAAASARTVAQQHLAKLDELFASLQHRAFTGQL